MTWSVIFFLLELFYYETLWANNLQLTVKVPLLLSSCPKTLKLLLLEAYFHRLLFLILNCTIFHLETATEKGAACSTSDHVEAANLPESFPPTIPKSESDTFVTTPDEDDDKIINTNTGLEGDGLEHRRPKKDLLEIDRFTICGNRIDWGPHTEANQSGLWQSCRVQGSDTGHGMCRNRHRFVSLA